VKRSSEIGLLILFTSWLCTDVYCCNRNQAVDVG